MGLGGILQELKTEGVLGLYHDYRSGTLRDWSGNGNNGVGTTVVFNKLGLKGVPAGSLVTVASNASWQWSTALTVIINYSLAGSQFDGVTGQYCSFVNGAPFQAFRLFGSGFGWSDGINLRTGGANPHLGNSAAVSLSNGLTGTAWINGLFISNLSGTSVIVAPASSLLLNYAQAGSWPVTTKSIVIIKRVLTATEHARVYGQLENMKWNTKGLTPGPMMP